MELLDFRKILVSQEIEVPIGVNVSAACKDHGGAGDKKVNLSIKFFDEEMQVLSPFLFSMVNFRLGEPLGLSDQNAKTVEGQFWTPLDANFVTKKKCQIAIDMVLREELDEPTEQEIEDEKEFVDPELEDQPKEEEAKKPEEPEGEDA